MTQAINASGWPIIRGIQTVKDLSYLNMKAMSAAAALDKLWSDTFLTNAGIYAAGSSGYTYQGTPNFNVIKTTGSPNVIPTMNGATTPSGVASASSTYSTSYPWQAMNKDGGTLNWSASNTTGWLKYDFGAGVTKTVKNYSVQISGFTGRAPYDWTLEGSNNDSDWTVIDTRTGIETWSANEKKDYDCSGNTTAYRYYRLNVTRSGGASGILDIGEWYLFEAAEALASIVSVLALDLAADVTQVMMFADVTLGTGTAAYYVSTDDGSTWTAVTLETLATVPAGKKIRLKVELTGDAQLESWGVAV